VIMVDNDAAVRHFRKYMNKAPNWVLNLAFPWKGLTQEEREADIKTAEFVPNRAMWRAQGFRSTTEALALAKELEHQK
jgi:hypothetical protein